MKLKEKKLKANNKVISVERGLYCTEYGNRENKPNIIYFGNPVLLTNVSWLAVLDKCESKRLAQLRST